MAIDKRDIGLGLALIFSGTAFVTAMITKSRYDKQKEENEAISKVIKDKLNMTIEEVKKANPIDISNELIKAAVEESADYEVARWAATDGQGIRTRVRKDIEDICKDAIDDIRSDIKPLVKHEMEEKAKQVSIDDIKKAVIDSTTKDVGKELNKRMDDEINKLVKEQNERIQTLNKVYDNINAALNKKGDDNGNKTEA